MNNFIFYLIGFFIVVYIARMIGEKAMKYLNTEQKAGLIDLFAKERKYGSVIVLGVIILFFIVLQLKLVKPLMAFSVYFGAMTAYVIFKNIRTNRKLSANNYPEEYIKKIVFANVLSTLGIIIFFVLIYYQFLID